MHFAQEAQHYLNRLKAVMDDLDLTVYARVVDDLLDAWRRQARIFVMGNGGSGATASHLACDINKGCCFDLDRKFKMICLNDNMPTVLALANDVSYEAVFEEQLKNFLEPADLVIGISGSGNSPNVLRAIAYAAAHGGRTQGWCGFGGGNLAGLVDLALVVPSDDMQQVEDTHIIVAHMLMQSLTKALRGGEAPACTLRE
ncbi:SIS domain-containing protein [Desulfatitalea alkaliphila]|uniref:SIS domain-containing protein n=1 Tax=Desulfatitalea alkaliphila TaxID=2929485 RepID=A0AA41R862_9BACT|nr:SIS domain-containing protein [Desulfatitalea alkaliphila]MCJ8502780.1 SIS domain-containing protein [Desulfatitalea alkaliphila]